MDDVEIAARHASRVTFTETDDVSVNLSQDLALPNMASLPVHPVSLLEVVAGDLEGVHRRGLARVRDQQPNA